MGLSPAGRDESRGMAASDTGSNPRIARPTVGVKALQPCRMLRKQSERLDADGGTGRP